MGLMELGCKLEDFGRLAQPAATNRLRCRVNVVSERYLVETHIQIEWMSSNMFDLCMDNFVCSKNFLFFVLFLYSYFFDLMFYSSYQKGLM